MSSLYQPFTGMADNVIAWKDRLSAAVRASRTQQATLAEVLYKQAIDLGKAIGPQSHEHVTSLINLADFYAAQNQPAKAEPLYRRVLTIYENLYGNNSFLASVCLQSLAITVEAQGKADEAAVLRARLSNPVNAFGA